LVEDRRREIGLFRYSLAREPSDLALSGAERGALVRALAAREHLGPDGRWMRVGRSTLDRWVRMLRAGGFEALVPAPRRGVPTTPVETLKLAETLKRDVPERTAAQVRRVMLESAGEEPTVVPSVRTLQRHFVRVGLNVRPDGGPPRVFGRFQAGQPNELWSGDALHGPVVGERKAILFAFIDDYSRLLPGYRWGYSEDVVRLEAALRSGLASRGVPKAILVDRGSAFVSGQLLRACATLGVRLIHARPYSPTTKGKIERAFETIRGQFLVEVAARAVADLAELNRLFSAWVEVHYHRAVHSETKARPIERFLEAGPPALPTPQMLREAFLWAEWRKVSKTAVVSLHGNAYEVDAALIGRRVELVFDPFDLARIEVRFEGRAMGAATPQKISRHTHPKARPDAAPAPEPSGIDYLGLLAARRDEELSGERISYADLAPDDSHHDDGQDEDNDDEQPQGERL
jgi:putative transposase